MQIFPCTWKLLPPQENEDQRNGKTYVLIYQVKQRGPYGRVKNVGRQKEYKSYFNRVCLYRVLLASVLHLC